MYQQHFRFDKRPFDGGIARDGDVYLGPLQQAVIDNLEVALSTGDSAVVLTGPPGVGKTTLACAALRAASTRLAIAWLGTVPADPQDLPQLLLAEFGLTVPAERMERLQAWRQFLSEMGATQSRVLVIVEHADDAATPVLRALEALTAADPNGCPGANLALTGQSALSTVLAAPALQALRQRVRLRQPLPPLDRVETERYLEHRLAAAGRRASELMPHASIDALHRYADGVPRVLNNLCETALTLAAARGATEIAPELVVDIAERLFGLGEGALAAEPLPADSAEAGLEVPVLTDAVELDERAAAALREQHEPALALLRDVRLEAQRAARLLEERPSFEAATAAFAPLGMNDVDEFAATALLRASRS